MAYKQTPYQRMWFPPPWGFGTAFAINASSTINSATLKTAALGPVIWGDRAPTKNISTVGFRFGTVVKTSNASNIRLSLQNLSTTSGPAQPSGTVLQSYTFTPSAPLSNTFFGANPLGAVQPVSYGQMLSVVWEYTTWTTPDSFIIGCGGSEYATMEGVACHTNFSASTWTSSTSLPAVMFGFDDGTYGTFDIQSPWPFFAATAPVLPNYNAPTDWALKFQLPFPVRIDAIAAYVTAPANATFALNIFDGVTGTLLGTAPMVANTLAILAAYHLCVGTLPSEVALSANHPYYAAVTATSVGTIGISYLDLATAAFMAAFPGGANFIIAQRLSGTGAWTDFPTRRGLISIGISSFDDGAGSAGATNLFFVED